MTREHLLFDLSDRISDPIPVPVSRSAVWLTFAVAPVTPTSSDKYVSEHQARSFPETWSQKKKLSEPVSTLVTGGKAEKDFNLT